MGGEESGELTLPGKNAPQRLKPPLVVTLIARLEAVRFHGASNVNSQRNEDAKM